MCFFIKHISRGNRCCHLKRTKIKYWPNCIPRPPTVATKILCLDFVWQYIEHRYGGLSTAYIVTQPFVGPMLTQHLVTTHSSWPYICPRSVHLLRRLMYTVPSPDCCVVTHTNNDASISTESGLSDW